MQHKGHLLKRDPVTGEPDPEQGWLTNNKFLYTDDGFETTKSVFGKYTYDGVTYYGILAEAIVGSVLVGTNLKIGNSNGTLTFDEQGFSVTNGTQTFTFDPNSNTIINLTDGDNKQMLYIGEDGQLHVVGDGSEVDISANNTVSEIHKTEEEIVLSVKNEEIRAKGAEGALDASLKSAWSQIEINAENIGIEVGRVESYVKDNYSTTKEMNAAIKVKADEITSSVSATYATNGTVSKLESRIKQTEDKIELTVTKDDVGTAITQNADSVRIAWNNNSQYISFEAGELRIYSSATHNNNTLLMAQGSYGARYYYNGNKVGKIGTGGWANDSNHRGLSFAIEPTSGYMCWTAQEEDDDTYTYVRLIYHHNTTTKGNVSARGFYFYEDIYTQGHLYLNDTYKFHTYTDKSVEYKGKIELSGETRLSGKTTIGGGINSSEVMIYGPTEFHESVTLYDDFMSNGYLYLTDNYKIIKYSGDDEAIGYEGRVQWHGQAQFFGGVQMCSTLDMNQNSIINQSDVRLKTNIHDTQVNALEIVNQIQMKEFNWIETGEHENVGMIAQQVQTIAPELVYENPETGILSIKTTKLIPYLLRAIQELTDYITDGASPFASRRTWTDTYSEEEKLEFVQSCAAAYEPHEEVVPEYTPPIEDNAERIESVARPIPLKV